MLISFRRHWASVPITPPPLAFIRSFTLIAVYFDLVRCCCYQRVSIASYANRWYSQRRNVHLSVRQSVCLSHSGIVSKRKKASVMISSPSESQNILVSGNIWLITKFDRGTPSEGDFWDWGGYELAILAIFRPINRNISETVQDRTKVTIDH